MDLGPGETERGTDSRECHTVSLCGQSSEPQSRTRRKGCLCVLFFSLVNRLTIDDLTIDRWRDRDGGIFLLLFLSFFLAEFEPVLGPISFFLISIVFFFLLLFFLSFGFQVVPGPIFL